MKKEENKYSKSVVSTTSKMMEQYKSMLFPQKETDIKMSIDGKICVYADGEYNHIEEVSRTLSIKKTLPELCVDIPIYSIGIPSSKLKTGDIIKLKDGFAYVCDLDRDNINYLSFNGVFGKYKVIKDIFSNESYVRVVTSMLDNKEMSPLILMSMMDGEHVDMKDILMMQMLNSNKEGFNPMMLMLMKGEGKDDTMSKMLMMQAMGNQSGDNNMMQMLMMMELMGDKKNKEE